MQGAVKKTRKELERELYELTTRERNAVAERDERYKVGLDRLLEAGDPHLTQKLATLPPEFQGPRTYVLTKPCFRGAMLPAGTIITVCNEVPSKTWRPATDDELRVEHNRVQKAAYRRMKAERKRGKA